MTPLQQRLVIGACLVVFAVWPPALAQRAQGRQGGSMYDATHEARFAGTVEEVKTVPDPGDRGPGGFHLALKTATETLDVHVGPVAFVKQLGVAVEKGDAVEILGSRLTIDNEVALLAREIRKGSHTWTLRDEFGRPLWSGGRR